MVSVWDAIAPVGSAQRPARESGSIPAAPSMPAEREPPRPVMATPRTQEPAPIAPRRPELSEMPTPETYGEAFRLGIQNIPESAGRVGGSLLQAVTNPIDTARSLGNIGYGLGSMAYGALGGEQDQEEKARNEASARSVIDMYGDYFEPGGLKRAIAYQPVETLLDVSTPLTLGGGAARGALGATTRAGRVAGAIENVGSVIDPVQSALSVARGAASVPVKALRIGQATASRVPYNTLEMIYDAARSGTREQRAAYAAGLSKDLPETAIVQKAVDALDAAADDASRSYVSGKSNLKSAAPKVNNIFSTIDDAEKNILVAGLPTMGMKNALDTIRNIRTEVTDLVNTGRFDLVQADAYKRSLFNLRDGLGDNAARNSVDQIAKSVRNSISDIDPNYAALMDQWQDWIRTAKGLREAGASGNLSVASSMTRLLNSMKSGLKKKSVIEVLGGKDPELPYLLAGYATREFHRGQLGLMESLIGAGLTYGFAHPGGIAAGLALGSPRLGGASQYALGRSAGLARTATQPAVTSGAYYGAQAGSQPVGQSDEISRLADAIAGVESAGSGGYGAIGSPDRTGDYPYGKYQIMGKNIGPWSKEILGREISAREFLENPELQEQIARGKLRQYMDIYGNPEDVASMWHSGVPASEAARQGRRDVLGTSTSEDYIPSVMSAMREGRASGGKVLSHKQEAEKLINAAAAAKKAESQGTEQLLALPDESVTHALAVANESI